MLPGTSWGSAQAPPRYPKCVVSSQLLLHTGLVLDVLDLGALTAVNRRSAGAPPQHRQDRAVPGSSISKANALYRATSPSPTQRRRAPTPCRPGKQQQESQDRVAATYRGQQGQHAGHRPTGTEQGHPGAAAAVPAEEAEHRRQVLQGTANSKITAATSCPCAAGNQASW